MRVAFFSPLPPSKSGIADYSQTLIEHLGRLADLEIGEVVQRRGHRTLRTVDLHWTGRRRQYGPDARIRRNHYPARCELRFAERGQF
jgi:hypothetical protein